MMASSNRERLEQEIVQLIYFIVEGRNFFFEKTGYSANSPDDFLNHFKSKELFAAHRELVQLELNIQLLYIKLSSYYRLVAKGSAGPQCSNDFAGVCIHHDHFLVVTCRKEAPVLAVH